MTGHCTGWYVDVRESGDPTVFMLEGRLSQLSI